MAGRTVQVGPRDIVLGHTIGAPRQVVTLTREQQTWHTAVFGKSGSGKSRYLQSFFLQHLSLGNAVAMLDPHNDLAYQTLAYAVEKGYFARSDAFDRLVYLEFRDDPIVPFNVLAGRERPQTMALNLLEAMFRVWPDLRRAPAFQTLFLAGVVTLRANNLPITSLHKLLLDDAFRASCLARVTDELVRETLLRFGNQSGKQQEAGSLLRRAFLLSFNDLSRLSFGQPDSVIPIRRWMDEGVSVIFNLGHIGDAETRALLGAILMVQIEQAALSRVDLAPSQRSPWTLVVDEWPVFSASGGTSIAHILEQTRKFGLRLVLSAQSTLQVPSDVLTAALENCRLHIAFGLGRQSAKQQAEDLATPMLYEACGFLDAFFPPPRPPSQREQATELFGDLQLLDPQLAYIKKDTQPPVKVRTLTVDDPAPAPAALQYVLDTYRQRYHRSQHEAQRLMQQSGSKHEEENEPALLTLFSS